MTKQAWMWNLSGTKCIRVKEIREHNIVKNEETGKFEVICFGFFGGGVTLFAGDKSEDCQRFIDGMTE